MATNTAGKNWPGSSVRTTWVSQREVFLYLHATHLMNGSFVAKVDPSVFEPFRPEHGSSSFVKTVQLCTKYFRTWSCTLAECRLLSSDGTKKCIVFLAVSRPTFLVSVSGLSQSHLPCLQQNLFSDPTPWTAKTEMYSLPVFLRQLVTRSILFYCNILTATSIPADKVDAPRTLPHHS